jgi:type II secretory pathway pseudopilin PulG
MITINKKVMENGGRKLKSRFRSQEGMSLIAIMAMMTLLSIALLAIAPSIQQSVQREKELESIRRGEEVAEAIRQYVEYHQGRKLPDSIDELLEGLPEGTKKRQILRRSAAVDPLSKDGKWRLISPTDKAFLNFGKRVQTFNNGLLPATPNRFLNRYAIQLANVVDTKDEDDLKAPDESEYEVKTSNTPFIGVSSQSKQRSVLTYYGIENHSKWLFTPLFRGTGGSQTNTRDSNTNSRPTSNTNTR